MLNLAPGTTVSIQNLISGGDSNQMLYSVVEFNTPSGQTSTITVNNSTTNLTNGSLYALPGVQYSNNTHRFSSDMPTGQSNEDGDKGAETYSTSNGASDLISSLSLTSGSFRNDNTNMVWTSGSTSNGVLSTSSGKNFAVNWGVGFNDHIILPNGVIYNGTLEPFGDTTNGMSAMRLMNSWIPSTMGLVALPAVEIAGTFADVGTDTEVVDTTSANAVIEGTNDTVVENSEVADAASGKISFAQEYNLDKKLGGGMYGDAYLSKDGKSVLKTFAKSVRTSKIQFGLQADEDPSFRAARIFNEIQEDTGHPELATATVVEDTDTGIKALKTPFIEGRDATKAELTSIKGSLLKKGILIPDLNVPGNVKITSDGSYRIIDSDLRVDFTNRSQSFYNSKMLKSPQVRTEFKKWNSEIIAK